MRSARDNEWPNEPYRGLQYYNAGDRKLFFGRQADIATCMHRLTSLETRILLLHGLTGCGKSSFLRAGLIPSVEEYGPSFYFLRDISGAPLFIRCGYDPLARIAEKMFELKAKPIVLSGTRQSFDIAKCLEAYGEIEKFVTDCHKPGVLCRVLQAIAQIVPATLVIVLDQAEEVITTALTASDHLRRRQFFRFIREFSAINIPVKLVVARRSEYSAQFIELGLYAGGIDLRAVTGGKKRSAHSPPGGIPVRSDLKPFHLRELLPNEVQVAILLPTSTSVADGNPYAKYKFTYAAGVAEAIVEDLFGTSSTSVLPAMQLTCRDLHKNLPSSREISAEQYREGGGISGPVDRHISESLRNSFNTLRQSELAAEEQRWRDVLCHLVQGESDGTVRTRIIGIRELRDLAQENGVLADVADVVKRLSEPDVLLLRVVAAIDSNDGIGLSLGHDFIGMVLQRWKVAEQAARLDREKIRGIRRRAVIVSLAAISSIAIASILFVLARAWGAANERYDVLVNRARFLEQANYRGSMLTAAQAIGVASRYSFWKIDDSEARSILARLVAGRPESSGSPSLPTEPKDSDAPALVLSLPVSDRFLIIRGDRVMNERGDLMFELTPPKDLDETMKIPPVYAAKETPAGELFLLVSRWMNSPKGGLRQSGELYVASNVRNGEVRRYDQDYFLGKLDAQPWSEPGKVLAFGDDLDLSLRADKGLVTLSALKSSSGKAQYWLRAFVYDRKKKSYSLSGGKLDGIPLDPRHASGLSAPLRLGEYVVVPEVSLGGTGDSNLVRYTLMTDNRIRDTRLEHFPIPLPPGHAWQFVDAVETAAGAWMFFGERTSDALYGDGRSNRLAQFRALVAVDVGSMQTRSLSSEVIRKARSDCGGVASEAEGSTIPEGDADLLYVTVRDAKPLIIVSRMQSAELVEINGNDAASCAGRVLFPSRVGEWAFAVNGTKLLGTTRGKGLRWNVSSSTVHRASELQLDRRLLVKMACESDLKEMSKSLSQRAWADLSAVPSLETGLSSGLCD